MPACNETNIGHATFLLAGIPGVEAVDPWISILFCSMYLMSILGNALILLVIKTRRSLHQPMYLFLSLLCATDLGLSASTLPTVLNIFLFNIRKIGFDLCLAQLFFVHTFSATESAILLAMAFDRFVAICHPLRYASILTHNKIGNIGLMAILRGSSLHFPLVLLVKRLPYIRIQPLSYSYCLHPDVMKVACGNTAPNIYYGLFLVLSTFGLDSVFIVLSYIMIIKTVMSVTSWRERLKALNTCISHICVTLLFYIPQFSLAVIHRFMENVHPLSQILCTYLHFLLPPVLNPIVYSLKTKEIRKQFMAVFHAYFTKKFG